jgi:nucleotide-binding universal stress UspA family protein
MRPVAVGVDDSPEGRLAAGVALQEAALRDVDLVAVRGWTLPPQLADADEKWAGPVREQQEAAEVRLLGEVLSSWRDQFPAVRVVPRLVPVSATHALTVASRDAQLLVVGDRGCGGFPGLSLGSVSEQVLHHSLCSVMVVRGAGAPALLEGGVALAQSRPTIRPEETVSAAATGSS